MTPEFDRRSSIVLGSSYWDIKPISDTEPGEEYLSRHKEFRQLQDAIGNSDSYEDLSDKMKALYDRAEAIALKDRAEWDEFVKNDTGGYGRFLETWTGLKAPVPQKDTPALSLEEDYDERNALPDSGPIGPDGKRLHGLGD